MMQIPGVGPLHSRLLAVRLVGGYAVTYGVWVGVHPGDLQRAFRVWWEPDYENLRLEGALCQLGPPMGAAGSPRQPGSEESGTHALLVARSSDPMLSRVLGEEWPHKDVLEALP